LVAQLAVLGQQENRLGGAGVLAAVEATVLVEMAVVLFKAVRAAVAAEQLQAVTLVIPVVLAGQLRAEVVGALRVALRRQHLQAQVVTALRALGVKVAAAGARGVMFPVWAVPAALVVFLVAVAVEARPQMVPTPVLVVLVALAFAVSTLGKE
jgi:hypothetical protein